MSSSACRNVCRPVLKSLPGKEGAKLISHICGRRWQKKGNISVDIVVSNTADNKKKRRATSRFVLLRLFYQVVVGIAHSV
jgi:hypothetical protein